jgi:hypothetical protein
MSDDPSSATAVAPIESEEHAALDVCDVAQALEELERQVRRLRGRGNDPAADLADAYGRLEVQWLRLAAHFRRLMPGAAGGSSHPLLTDADQWRFAAERLGLEGAAQRARHFVRACAVDEASELNSSLAPLVLEPELTRLFEGLSRISALEMELGLYLDSSSSKPAELQQLAAARSTHDLAELRQQLRTAFSAALAVNPPDEYARESWRTQLADRCDTALTAVDDVPPDRAAVQLQVVADDVEWHVRHVETQRGAPRRRLHTKARRLRAEQQERVLQGRLERRFGRAAVAWVERVVLVLIFVVLGLLAVETVLPLSEEVRFWLTLVDSAACGVFLVEFGVKLWYVPGRWRWFYRHALIDLLPSIPFGLLTLPQADVARAGRLLRLLRLGRLVRYVRILRPVIRLYRALGFLCRGMDRLARHYSPHLNRNVILYPTRAERLAARQQEKSLTPRLRRLKAELHEHWSSLLGRAAEDEKEGVAMARLAAWDVARLEGLTRRSSPAAGSWSDVHDIPLEALVRWLGSLTPRDVEQQIDEELTARLARVVRTFSRRPVCWLPIIRSLVPRVAPNMSDAHVVSAAAQTAAEVIGRHYGRWLWASDLHGTVTPSQVIDRLGTVMMRGAIRPASRLAVLGVLFGLTQLLVGLTPNSSLALLRNFLNNILGPTLMLLGSVCVIVLGLGWWLRRIAQRATEFYERAAHAQFLPLTEIIRCRHMEQSGALLHDRVLASEWRLRDPAADQRRGALLDIFLQRIRQSLLGEAGGPQDAPFPALDRVVLLYRDSLDGAPFGDSDVRTTTQLLGNPAIGQVLELSRRVGRKEARRLESLDLDRQKALLGGPYLWFNCISRSIAHGVACNLVDYNRHAIPLDEWTLCGPEERERYQAWLEAGVNGGDAKATQHGDVRCVTTAFTALHFLDYDAQRDSEIELRFGARVLERLRRDRSMLVRRVFGTYPWHRLPRDQRVLNLYALYVAHLSGGRALLLPFTVAWRGVRLCWSGVRWVHSALREILHPDRDYSAAAEADFATATRKIQRMRGPIVVETMRLRAKIDPEYLGVPLPGRSRTHLGGANVEADLKFLEARPSLIHEMERHRARAEGDMRRLSKLIDDGLLSRVAQRLGLPPDVLSGPEHVRAVAVAYLGDYRGVRSLLSCEDVLYDVYHVAPLEFLVAPLPWPRVALRRCFRRYWQEHGFGGRAERAAAWRATVHDLHGAASALRAWAKHGKAAAEEGERVLGELLRHPGRITEQLVALRAIQTLALLDILHYREHVYVLGQYADLGDDPGELLTWGRGEQMVMVE